MGWYCLVIAWKAGVECCLWFWFKSRDHVIITVDSIAAYVFPLHWVAVHTVLFLFRMTNKCQNFLCSVKLFSNACMFFRLFLCFFGSSLLTDRVWHTWSTAPWGHWSEMERPGSETGIQRTFHWSYWKRKLFLPRPLYQTFGAMDGKGRSTWCHCWETRWSFKGHRTSIIGRQINWYS